MVYPLTKKSHSTPVRLITLSVAVWAAVSLAESVQSQSFTETKLIDLPDEAKLLISENGQSFAAIKKVGSRTAVDFNGQVGPRFSSIKSLQLSRNGKTVAYLGEKAGIYYPVINHTSHDPIVSEYGNLQHAYGEVILPQSDQFAFTIQPSFGNINVGLNPKLGFFVISDDGTQDFKLGIDNLATKLIQGQQPSQVAFSPSGDRFALSLEIRK